jgi:Cu-processing system ATP-binding protein
LLELRGLARRFAGVHALRRVDASLAVGDRVLVAGPNGAGKSTLLRLITGLSAPTAGVLAANGATSLGASWRQRLGYLDHRGLFYDELTARENLVLFARLHGSAVAEEASRRALDAVGLTWAAERRAGGFSRGMRQRLGLARALMGDPELLVLDEPLIGLDDDGRSRVVACLDAWLAAGAPRTLLIASHEIEVLAPLVNRLWVMMGGCLVADELVEPRDGGTLRERVRMLSQRASQ